MRHQSLPGHGVERAREPGSEAIADSFANQRKTDGSLLIPEQADASSPAVHAEPFRNLLSRDGDSAEDPHGEKHEQHDLEPVRPAHVATPYSPTYEKGERHEGRGHGKNIFEHTNETPAEHIGNVLAILDSYHSLNGVVCFDADEVDAMHDRLTRALQQLRAPQVIYGHALADFMADLATKEPNATDVIGERERQRALEVANGERSRRPGCLPRPVLFVAALLAGASRVEVWR